MHALKIDLRHLDFAVISHRHGDHTGGLSYLLRVNPTVTIYAPYERFGLFGGPVPASIIRPDTALPRRMRYFAGAVPEELRSSTVWPATQRRFAVSSRQLPNVRWSCRSDRHQVVWLTT